MTVKSDSLPSTRAHEFFKLFQEPTKKDTLLEFIQEYYRGKSTYDQFFSMLSQLFSMHPQPTVKDITELTDVNNTDSEHTTFEAYCVDTQEKWFKLNLQISPTGKIVGFSAFPATPLIEGPKITMEELIHEMREFVAIIEKEEDFAGSFLLANPETDILEIHAGYRNEQKQIPHDKESKYNVASMSKMFTAIAIAILFERQLIKLDAPIGNYLIDLNLPDDIAKITSHQLLTHTSGLGMYWEEIQGKEDEFVDVSSFAKLLSTARLQPIKTGIMYSNLGFETLGLLIEKISGLSYYDFVKQNIFQPLEMNNSDYLTFNQADERLSLPYSANHGSPGIPMKWPSARGSAAGGCVSTIYDLSKFLKGLLQGKIIQEETLNLFIEGKEKMTPDGSIMYAYGFGVHENHGIITIGHNGGAPGINGDARYFSTGHIAIVLANRDPDFAGRIITKFGSLVARMNEI